MDPLAQRGWRVLHDRAVPRSSANIDHVLVGPAGVIVIDTKSHQGRLTIDTDGVRINRWAFGGKVTKLQGYGSAVAAVVAGRAPVYNLVCFTSEVGLTAPGRWDQTTLLELRQLQQWLDGLPPVQTPRQAWDLGELLEGAFPDRLAPTAALLPAPPPPAPRPRATVARRTRARRAAPPSRNARGPTMRRLVALLALIIGLGVIQHVGVDAFVPQSSAPHTAGPATH